MNGKPTPARQLLYDALTKCNVKDGEIAKLKAKKQSLELQLEQVKTEIQELEHQIGIHEAEASKYMREIMGGG